MKSYEEVLKIVKETKSLAAHIKALGKVRPKTEDQVLLNKIDKAISSLQDSHLRNTKGKSIIISLDKATDHLVKDLVDYCNKSVAAKKPEWQVIAERKGWAPKT